METLSVREFASLFYDGVTLREHPFCFVLGAGASRAAGILTGIELAKKWMEELEKRFSARELARMRQECGLKPEDVDVKTGSAASQNYENVYRLRFHKHSKDGYAYLENVMKKARPSYGHYPLARILAETAANLVITTNFDSLVEDSLFTYTNKKPLVIGHESLIRFVDINRNRPTVAKLHRSLFFDPINATNEAEDVRRWNDSWSKALDNLFRKYTPIVIGYNGGDHTFMDYLERDGFELPCLYWCYRGEDIEPNERIQKLVEKHHGCFVKIEISEAFDYFMFELGRAFEYESPEKMLREKVEGQIGSYNEQEKELGEAVRNIENPTEAQEEIINSMENFHLEKIQHFTKLIERNPNNGYSYYLRAKHKAALEIFDGIIDDISKSIELIPGFSEGYSFRGEMCRIFGSWAEALEDYNKAIELEPKNVSYYVGRADCYFQMENYEMALAEYNKIIELDSNYYYAYHWRANVYDELNEPAKAAADRKKEKELEEGKN
jgi:tetratricopeptide (TPR) repeat protein